MRDCGWWRSHLLRMLKYYGSWRLKLWRLCLQSRKGSGKRCWSTSNTPKVAWTPLRDYFQYICEIEREREVIDSWEWANVVGPMRYKVPLYFTKVKFLYHEISKLDFASNISDSIIRRIIIHELWPECRIVQNQQFMNNYPSYSWTINIWSRIKLRDFATRTILWCNIKVIVISYYTTDISLFLKSCL